MVIYCLQHVFVYLYRITLAELCNKFILLEALVVTDYLIANVGPFGWAFFEHFTEDADIREALDGFELSIFHLQSQKVHVGIFPFLEKATLYTHHNAVLVEGLADGAHPLVLREFLDKLLHCLDVSSILAVINHTAVVWLVPSILLFILFEIGGQCQRVLCGRFPDAAVAFFKEKQTVVVLLHKVFQFVVLGAELLGLLVENLFNSLSFCPAIESRTC